MLEELKAVLLNRYMVKGNAILLDNSSDIKFVHLGICLLGAENEISIYYNPEEPQLFEKSRYLDKLNTIKVFHSVCSAINYLDYLYKIKEDVKYELYHYFLFKLKKSKIEYGYLQTFVVSDSTAIRCDMGMLKLNGKPLLYNFIITFKDNGLCWLGFYPEQPLWDEQKVCPENDLDGIVDYITNLTVNNYHDIPLTEQ